MSSSAKLSRRSSSNKSNTGTSIAASPAVVNSFVYETYAEGRPVHVKAVTLALARGATASPAAVASSPLPSVQEILLNFAAIALKVQQACETVAECKGLDENGEDESPSPSPTQQRAIIVLHRPILAALQNRSRGARTPFLAIDIGDLMAKPDSQGTKGDASVAKKTVSRSPQHAPQYGGRGDELNELTLFPDREPSSRRRARSSGAAINTHPVSSSGPQQSPEELEDSAVEYLSGRLKELLTGANGHHSSVGQMALWVAPPESQMLMDDDDSVPAQLFGHSALNVTGGGVKLTATPASASNGGDAVSSPTTAAIDGVDASTALREFPEEVLESIMSRAVEGLESFDGAEVCDWRRAMKPAIRRREGPRKKPNDPHTRALPLGAKTSRDTSVVVVADATQAPNPEFVVEEDTVEDLVSDSDGEGLPRQRRRTRHQNRQPVVVDVDDNRVAPTTAASNPSDAMVID